MVFLPNGGKKTDDNINILLNGEKHDVTNFSPVELSIDGSKYKTESWPDVLQIVCECCAQKNCTKLLKYFNFAIDKISTSKNEKYPSRKIKNTDYYINVHGDANKLFNEISGLSDAFNLVTKILIKKN